MPCSYRRVTYPGLGSAVGFSTPYDVAFVDDLKDDIPPKQRRWSPENKAWFISEVAADDVFDLCETYFGEEPYEDEDLFPDLPDNQKPRDRVKVQLVDKSDGWSTLGLLPTADPDVAKAAYRTLCAKYHPDKGGSEDAMKVLNNAWDKVRKLLK